MKYIAVETLKQIIDDHADLTLIDVRSAEEYRISHIPQAHSLPLDVILNHPEVAISKVKEMTANKAVAYLVCLSDVRASVAWQRLVALGFHNIVVVKGGTKAWIASHYPVISNL